MIGLDTNVVVRILTGNDEKQVAAIRNLLTGLSPENPAYISAIVLAEAIWVLESRLGYLRPQVLAGIEHLLASRELRIEHSGHLANMLEQRDSDRIDLADHLVAWSAEAVGCTHTMTFDRRAATTVSSMELLS